MTEKTIYTKLLTGPRNFTMASLITADPAILGGKPIIRGTRISVDFILELYAAGVTRDEILTDYPHLTPEALSACLAYKIK